MKKSVLLSLGILGLFLQSVPAQILYQQNFESPVITGSSTNGPGGFVQANNIGGSGWQIQGGGGGGGVTLIAGIDNNGVGGSQGLFANWDQSAASSFSFNQYTIYGGIAAPGAGILPSQIQISLQIFMSGSESSLTPIQVDVQNGVNDLLFTPTLANGVYSPVLFTLDQASNANLFDPLVSSNLRIQHGAGGFGFDANNVVEMDNILVQVVPEPGTATLLGLGLAALLVRHRRS